MELDQIMEDPHQEEDQVQVQVQVQEVADMEVDQVVLLANPHISQDFGQD